jgi:hypothetical protein
MQTKMTPVPPQIGLLEAVTYAQTQEEYAPLPACRTEDGEVVSCFKPNLLARLAVLFGAKFYLTQLTFNRGLPPIRVSVRKPVYVIPQT